MARNALLGIGMVAPDDEWRLTRAVNALGFGPMTQTTQAGRPNALLSAGMPTARPNDYLAPVAETISPTMGGYGAGQMIGEGSRAIGQGDYLSGGAGLALGMAGMIPGAPKKGIRAFHGSPHDFDRFDMSKIGTGEGAQAYGHGLYFAESEGVAKSYRDKLQDVKYGGSPIDPSDPSHVARAFLESNNGDAVKAASFLRERAKNMDWELNNAAADLLEKGGQIPDRKASGRMYEVRINADPEDFLDWDKPLSQQGEKVRGAWQKLLDNRPEYADPTKVGGQYRNPKGQELYSAIFEHVPGMGVSARSEVTERLREAGIPGIKYLDQGSRGAGDGSRNYVVFRDDIIDIVKKYGLAAAVSTYGFDAVRGAMEDQQQ